MKTTRREPKLAVFEKSPRATDDQLSLLDCEDELLALARDSDRKIVEAASASVSGPYDLSLVEASVTTAEPAKWIRQIRRQSGLSREFGAVS